MKNTIKFLGIIALVAIIGFSMAACGEPEGASIEGASIKVVNQNSQVITYVSVGLADEEEWGLGNVNIAPGSSQTFSTKMWGDNRDVTVRFGTEYVYGKFRFDEKKTTTVTLTAEGTLR
jgi:hypothetical protein